MKNFHLPTSFNLATTLNLPISIPLLLSLREELQTHQQCFAKDLVALPGVNRFPELLEKEQEVHLSTEPVSALPDGKSSLNRPLFLSSCCNCTNLVPVHLILLFTLYHLMEGLNISVRSKWCTGLSEFSQCLQIVFLSILFELSEAMNVAFHS